MRNFFEKRLRDKRGAFTDLFVFMIFAIVIVFVSVIMIYVVGEANTKLKDEIGGLDLHDTEGNNATEVVDNTVGEVDRSFQALHWITIFLIVGMILSIFVGSYLVTTKPVFFIGYLFITIIAIVVSVPISNTYETLMENATLSSTFAGFTGANWIMLNLPIWITIVGIAGSIIMFARMGKREERYY